jgi:hypothetical protein
MLDRFIYVNNHFYELLAFALCILLLYQIMRYRYIKRQVNQEWVLIQRELTFLKEIRRQARANPDIAAQLPEVDPEDCPQKKATRG